MTCATCSLGSLMFSTSIRISVIFYTCADHMILLVLDTHYYISEKTKHTKIVLLSVSNWKLVGLVISVNTVFNGKKGCLIRFSVFA